MMTPTQKFDRFRSLHVPGNPVVLYNIWDAGGAVTLAQAGAQAIATSSWSVAAAQGFEDGEIIPLDFVLQIVARIASTVDLPLTVDFEGGYATEAGAITANVRKVIAAGAVGLNFEDQVVGGEGVHPLDTQVGRIAAVRNACDQDRPLFINARTDLFLQSGAEHHAGLVGEAIARGAAYAKAGADGLFIPGLTQPDLIRQVCEGVDLPVNVMMRGGSTSLRAVAALGVARASYGPGPYSDAQADLTARFKALQ